MTRSTWNPGRPAPRYTRGLTPDAFSIDLHAVGRADDESIAQVDEQPGIEDAGQALEPEIERLGIVDARRTGNR